MHTSNASAGSAPVHSSAFRFRRFLNWFPLGLTYAFLYMGRYNLNVAKTALGPLMTEEDFGLIFAAGTVVYGFSFVLNGPLTDKIGGRLAMLISALGSGLANVAMGWYLLDPTARTNAEIVQAFSLLYAVNMYFQSFGAVAIVKVNSSWFHVRERGGFSGIFGTMISSGIFMAFTVNAWLLSFAASRAATSELVQAKVVFFVPAALLFTLFVVEAFLLKDRPSQAGHQDFDTGDASSGEGDVSLRQIVRGIFTNPIILTVALIEFCTGVVRQGIMQSYPFYAKNVLALPSAHYMRNGSWGEFWIVATIFAVSAAFLVLAYRTKGPRKGWLYVSGGLVFLTPFLQGGWGGLLFVAGVIGGNVAGWVSDIFFQSRRAPAAGGLYGMLLVCSVIMVFVMGRTTTELAQSRMVVAGKVAPGTEIEVAGRAVKVDAEGRYRTEVAVEKGQSAIEVAMVAAGGRTVETRPVEVLWPGDKIVEVAGQPVQDWAGVARAIASIPPAECTGGSQWDSAKSMCSSKPSAETQGALTLFLDRFFGSPPSFGAMAASAGVIPLLIERDGARTTIELKDWALKQRAGEPRVMRATPSATMPAWLLGFVVILMSLCVIGTHGLLSGTATMDFGGRKGAATAVGMIDGFVYLGTAVQSVSLGYLTTRSWSYWPWFLMPFALAGFLLCRRIWHAKPKARATPAAEQSSPPAEAEKPAA